MIDTVLVPLVPGKGERTRSRLLEIAIRRFAAEGYRRTSVSDVAREAGLTPAAVYAYFAGKEALFKAAVDADAGALIDDAGPDLGRGTARELFAARVAELVARVDDHPLARRVLAGQEPEVIGRLLDLPSLNALTAAFAEQLAEGQEGGDVRRDIDPAAIATGMEAIVLCLLMGVVQAGVDPASEMGAGVAEVLDAALRPS
ncbi:MAG: TetR/AcrR family transcriptional regulator [Acidimicrobiia bacterium]